MGSLKDWRNFYKKERNQIKEFLKKEAEKHFRKNDRNKKVEEILNKDSIISFPHTFLKDNYKIYFDIIKALYVLKKKKIMLLGVLHTRKDSEKINEFSLDNFTYCLNIYSKINNLPKLKIKKLFIPLPPAKKDSGKISKYLKKLEKISSKIKKENVEKILATGDLAHYGHGYYSKNIYSNYKTQIKNKILKILDDVYIQGNFTKLIKSAKNIGFDQTSVAIIIKMLLGNQTKYKIINKKWSDYSKVLNSKKPTVVASITYGVYKKE